jgi:hypothetical protein
MFPGCFYLIGMWYKREEAQKRFSFFFSSTTLAGGFGGLIAAGIGKMDGVGGYRNWRWVSESSHPSCTNPADPRGGIHGPHGLGRLLLPLGFP